MVTDLRKELATLSLAEPVIGELRHGLTRLDQPDLVALLGRVRIAPSVPSGWLACEA